MSKRISMEVAASMLSNYRRQYKDFYNEEFNGSDIELLKIINDEPTWSSGLEQDMYTLESMAEFHDGNRINKVQS